MTSLIDATKPVSGVPAVKADLRANLSAAKTEIEALQASSSHVRVDIRQHGAIPAGSGQNVAANTAAIQAAIQEAHALRGGSEVFIPHDTAFDPTAIEWRYFDGSFHDWSVNLALAGAIYPTTTWIVDFRCWLHGVGNMPGTQYQLDIKSAEINRPAGLTVSQATIEIRSPLAQLIEGIKVNGDAGIAIKIIEAPNTEMRYVGAYCGQDVSTAVGIVISDTYWIDLFRCNATMIGTTDKAAVLITNEEPGNNETGGVNLRTLRTSGGSVRIVKGTGAAITSVYITDDMTAENLINIPMIHVATDTQVDLLYIEQAATADSTMAALIKNEGTIGLLHYRCEGVSDTGTFLQGNRPQRIIYSAGRGPARRWGPTGTYPTRSVLTVDGEVEAAQAFRGYSDALQTCPFAVMPVSHDGTTWWPDTGVTITAGIRDPDGGTTAYRLTNPTGGRLFCRFTELYPSFAPNIGDHIICGAWVRNLGYGSGDWDTEIISIRNGGSALRFVEAPPGTGGDIVPVHSDLARMQDRGWMPLVARVTVAQAGDNLYAYAVLQAGQVLDMAWPFVLLGDSSVYTAFEAERIRSTITRVLPGVAPGHVGLMPGMTMKLGGTDAVLPSASAVGAGALWYDQTYGPVWSNGTRWGALGAGFANTSGSQASQPSGGKWKMTGAVTAVPIADRWEGLYLNFTAGPLTLTPASGTCRVIETKSSSGSVTVPMNGGIVVMGDGTDLVVMGDVG